MEPVPVLSGKCTLVGHEFLIFLQVLPKSVVLSLNLPGGRSFGHIITADGSETADAVRTLLGPPQPSIEVIAMRTQTLFHPRSLLLSLSLPKHLQPTCEAPSAPGPRFLSALLDLIADPAGKVVAEDKSPSR
jgi:hypothetical protein